MRTALVLTLGLFLAPVAGWAQTVTLTGQLDAHLMGNPTLTTADNKAIELAGSKVAQLEGADGQRVEIKGQMTNDGSSECLVVDSWKLVGDRRLGNLPQNGLPPAYGPTSINPAYGAPPQMETVPADQRPR